ncbi:MAG: glycosyltransferase family 2 protein [Candidatus Glassbacteria bacterium]
MITYSLIIPVNNEQESLPVLMAEIDAVRRNLAGELEVIFIDDGSTDRSFDVLKELRDEYAYIRIIRFDKRYGQSSAFSEGFKSARGEIIITMDADLQNDPGDILKLLEFYPDYDVITGKRTRRRDSIIKILSSKIANSARNWLTDEDIVDTGCSLKIFSGRYVKNLKLYEGLHRFLPTLCKLEGAKVIEVEVSHRERRFGKTHYGIGNRLFRSLNDAFAVRWMKKRAMRYKIERRIE